MKQSVTMKEKINLYTALSKVSFGSIDESAQNSHQKYSYAKLKDLYNAVKGPLKEQGLRINHARIRAEDGSILQQTYLVHVPTGEYQFDECVVVPDRPGVQGFAAACTYIKKMAIKNLCGIDTGEDDDDGESGHIYREDIGKIVSLIKNHKDGKNIWEKIKTTYGVNNPHDIHPDNIKNIFKFINEYKGE